jgi:signal transduction histidine kinase
MDKTERVLHEKYNEIEQEAQVRTHELVGANAALRAEIERLKQAEEAHRFIADAIEIVATSPDYQLTIQNLARIAVPTLGEWCAVYMLERDQQIRRLAVAGTLVPHRAINGIDAILQLDAAAPLGPARVIRTGEQESADTITDELLGHLGITSEHLAALPGEGSASYICVPLPARGRCIGAIAFILKRPLVELDIALTRHLTRSAGLVIESARLLREAQDANRLKDEFVAMVSHELRTPLTPILGCVHLLRTAKLTDVTSARALDMIERNAQAQVQIVEDLLDLSRVVAGKLHLTLQAVQIVPVIEAAIDSVRAVADSKTIRIIRNIDAQHGVMDGDKDRLQQIFWNLLSNAVKFTPAGGRIVVSARPVDGHVKIDIADTGIGIAPEFLPYVFDRYRQAETLDTGMRSGLGLGLAIVRHLVELHNGYIDVASPGIGQGTVFTVRLPLQAQKAAHTR